MSDAVSHFAGPVRAAAKWVLPVLLLALILRQVDLQRLMALGASAHLWPIVAGISLGLPKVLAGALRWHVLAARWRCSGLPLRGNLTEYWASLAVGTLLPGTVGSDVYRVALCGRRTGRFGTTAFAIVIEKLVALVGCTMLIAITYPLVDLGRLSATLAHVIDLIYLLAIGTTLVVLTLTLMHRSAWFETIVTRLGRSAARLSSAASRRIGTSHPVDESPSLAPAQLVREAMSPSLLLAVLGSSLVIHITSAIQAQLYLHALGYDLPFMANLFVAPLTILMVSLPITVGGLGVREASYVVCYSAFGVPTEVALLVSFIYFLATVSAHGLGALFIIRWRRNAA